MDASQIQEVTVRRLRPDDLEAVIAIDQEITGRRREEFFKLKLEQALSRTGVEASLGAEVDGRLKAFLLCWVFYGEFGQAEPFAVLDTLGVHPDFRGRGVGHAMLDQLRINLLGLNISCLQTQVSWHDHALIAFFSREGFAPARRIAMDLELRYTD